jgi:hypothetical protein
MPAMFIRVDVDPKVAADPARTVRVVTPYES